MSTKNQHILNRPLTPHLTIYSSQLTSLYSIWHRISGVVLILLLICFFIILKFNIYFPIQINLQFHLNNLLWIRNTLFVIFLLNFLYHMFNGIRHIIWDLGYNLSIKRVVNSSKFIVIILISYSLFLLKKIIN